MKIEGTKFVCVLPGKPNWTLNAIGGKVIACASGYRPRVIEGITWYELEVDGKKDQQPK